MLTGSVAVNRARPGEALIALVRPQPILSPAALAGVLSPPAGPLGQIQKIRDADLDRISAWCKQNGNSAQRALLDRYAFSQQQARSIADTLLGTLANIKDNSPDSQVAAAVVLFRMNVAPVVSIHIPFGGDNHTDTSLATEAKQTVAGVAAIGNLWTQLNAAGLQDRVTFAMMNVFGRTLSAARNTNGRDHQSDHRLFGQNPGRRLRSGSRLPRPEHPERQAGGGRARNRLGSCS